MREDGRSVICFIGIGSNIADSVSNCLESIDHIVSSAGSRLSKRSSLYWTEPVGVTDQEWFVNCVIEIETNRRASTLLKNLQGIEDAMGRIRGERWGPRIIDLDMLLYGQEVISEEGLLIPHPELHKRRFVLVPINEIASYTIHPAFGVSMKGLLDRLEDTSTVEIIEGGSCTWH